MKFHTIFIYWHRRMYLQCLYSAEGLFLFFFFFSIFDGKRRENYLNQRLWNFSLFVMVNSSSRWSPGKSSVPSGGAMQLEHPGVLWGLSGRSPYPYFSPLWLAALLTPTETGLFPRGGCQSLPPPVLLWRSRCLSVSPHTAFNFFPPYIIFCIHLL